MNPLIAASLISGGFGLISSKIGKTGVGGQDWNYKQHRQLWTERLRFNQDSFRARNNLADLELARKVTRQGRQDQYLRSKALADAITGRNIRGQNFEQTLGMNNRSFQQQQDFSGRAFQQGQYFEGMRLNTETAGRAGQRGIAERQRMSAMFPEASPWDLMGSGGAAAAGQSVMPGYPSAASANVAAGPSPEVQMRAVEQANADALASQLLPTPAVKAAQTAAHAQMYSSTVHAMSGLAEAMINARAPGRMADIAGRKAPTEIDLMAKRGALASVQSGTEAGKQSLQDEDLKRLRAENKYASKYYKGRAQYESNKTTLGYLNSGLSGLGAAAGMSLLNKLGGKIFRSADGITKKLSRARKIKSSVQKPSAPSKESHADSWKSIREAEQLMRNFVNEP